MEPAREEHAHHSGERLSREQLAELQRLLTSFADNTGVDLTDDAPDRAAEAERRAVAAEEAARDAADRAERAEEAVRSRPRPRPEPSPAPPRPKSRRRPVDHYDDLAAEEVIALLASLELDDLETLRDYERNHANRPRVVGAIESVLARRGSTV